MKCPYCGAEESKVIDSRPTEDSERIRRSAVMPDRLQQRKYRGSGNMRYRREVGEATTSIVNHKFVT